MDEAADDVLVPEIDLVWQAYHHGEAKRGIVLGRQAVQVHPGHGEAWYALACCLERDGDLLGADRCFGRAARSLQQRQARPWRVGWPRFTAIVADAVELLPPALHQVVRGELSLVLANYADPQLSAGLADPDILGCFVGAPKGEELSAPAGTISPTVFLFRRAHEHATSDQEQFVLEVRRTLYHEVGHYVGFDEDGLDELGMG